MTAGVRPWPGQVLPAVMLYYTCTCAKAHLAEQLIIHLQVQAASVQMCRVAWDAAGTVSGTDMSKVLHALPLRSVADGKI